MATHKGDVIHYFSWILRKVEEKALLARVMAMYGVVASVSLIARFERVRRQESAERERELQRERIELSQTIHDTVAQTAYMISLGIHRAIRQAGASNEELTATLAAVFASNTSSRFRRYQSGGPARRCFSPARPIGMNRWTGTTSRHSPTTSWSWPPGSAVTVTGGSPPC